MTSHDKFLFAMTVTLWVVAGCGVLLDVHTTPALVVSAVLGTVITIYDFVKWSD